MAVTALSEMHEVIRETLNAAVRFEVVHLDDDRTRIWLIRTPKHLRRRGLASCYLAEFCDMADTQGRTLILTPDPLDDSISVTDLVEWYQRFGFEWTDESTMTRHPRR